MDVEDEEEEEEEDGDSGVDELVGGEGGDILKDYKGVLRTNFGTCKGIPSFFFKERIGIYREDLLKLFRRRSFRSVKNGRKMIGGRGY